MFFGKVFFIFFDHLPVWLPQSLICAFILGDKPFAVSTLPSLSESPGFPCVLSWKKQMLYLDYLFSWGPGEPFRKIIVFHGTLKETKEKLWDPSKEALFTVQLWKVSSCFLCSKKFHSWLLFFIRMSYFIFKSTCFGFAIISNSSFSDSSHLPCWVPVQKVSLVTY